MNETFVRVAAYSNSVDQNFAQYAVYFSPVNERFCEMVHIVNRVFGALHPVLTSTKFELALTKLLPCYPNTIFAYINLVLGLIPLIYPIT